MWAMSYQKLKDLSPEASERVIRFLYSGDGPEESDLALP